MLNLVVLVMQRAPAQRQPFTQTLASEQEFGLLQSKKPS